jgi:hypothetical protein
MKTFLKVLLVLIVTIIAVKLLPLTIALGFALGLALVVVAALGLSAIAILICVALALAALLSPIWLPILALFGLIALIKRGTRDRSTPPSNPSAPTGVAAA